ncbi:MAG: NusG domain II-containing protein [Enterococcus sp.]
MNEFIKKTRLKPWDGIIILLLIVLSFIPLIFFSWQQGNNHATSKEAVLRVDGEEIKTFPLSAGQESYTYRFQDADGDSNLIEVAGEKIRIKEADCKDQVCVRRGWASKTGETIVCLPHKLVIEIIATGGEHDELIY